MLLAAGEDIPAKKKINDLIMGKKAPCARDAAANDAARRVGEASYVDGASSPPRPLATSSATAQAATRPKAPKVWDDQERGAEDWQEGGPEVAAGADAVSSASSSAPTSASNTLPETINQTIATLDREPERPGRPAAMRYLVVARQSAQEEGFEDARAKLLKARDILAKALRSHKILEIAGGKPCKEAGMDGDCLFLAVLDGLEYAGLGLCEP